MSSAKIILRGQHGQYTFQPRRLFRRGGMSYLFRGENTTTRQPVVVKVLKKQFAANPMYVKRTERESQIRVTHRNVVQVYDYLVRDGKVHLVLEYIEGQNVQELIDQHNAAGTQLSVGRVAKIIQDVLRGLSVVHGLYQPIIHRDIKPANIIVSHRTGEAKITDFGIAKIIGQDPVGEDRVTRMGMQIGTPAYQAPEQRNAQHDLINETTDLYSTGLMLYEMLTGRLPAGSGAPLKLDPGLPHHRSIPRGLLRVVERATQPAQNQRFASAKEFSDAITAALRSGGSLGRRSFDWHRVPLWTWVSLLLGAGVLVLLALLILNA